MTRPRIASPENPLVHKNITITRDIDLHCQAENINLSQFVREYYPRVYGLGNDIAELESEIKKLSQERNTIENKIQCLEIRLRDLTKTEMINHAERVEEKKQFELFCNEVQRLSQYIMFGSGSRDIEHLAGILQCITKADIQRFFVNLGETEPTLAQIRSFFKPLALGGEALEA